MNKRIVDGLLVVLIFLDVLYDVVIFPSPETWFRIMHGTPYVDPQALLRRTAACWAAFAFWQIIALLKWKQNRHWLMLVAGIRWTEIFADWTYLYFCQNITLTGKVGLFLAAPVNLFTGWFFYRAYFKAATDSGTS